MQPLSATRTDPAERTSEETVLDRAKIQRLYELVDGMKSVAVAFSAGIDSTLVLKVCQQRLGEKTVAVIGVSPSLPPGELQEARQLAEALDSRLVEITTEEFSNEEYLQNPVRRCYFCKKELYRQVIPYAREHDFATVVDGTNVDDLGDVRPGTEAAEEAGVRHPLLEAGFSKAEIRQLARELGLPNWNKPALACLSSRIPHGTGIKASQLQRLGQAELQLRMLGLPRVRLRAHGEIGRLEVEPADLELAFAVREKIVALVKQAGFTYVALDLEGYRTGSLHEVQTP
jgi:uncharacterized protein